MCNEKRAKFMLLCLIVLTGTMMVLDVSLVVAWTYPKEPVKTLPTTVVYSPPSAVFGTSDVPLNFSIIPPASWSRDDGYDAYLKQVSYQLDNKEPVVLLSVESWWNENTVGIQNFSATLAGVTDGPHRLLLNITIASPYDVFSPGDPHGHFARREVWQAPYFVEFKVASTVSPSDSVAPSPLSSVPGANPQNPTESNPQTSSESLTSTMPPYPNPTLPTPNTSPSQAVPEFTPVTVLVLGAAVCLAAAAYRKRRAT